MTFQKSRVGLAGATLAGLILLWQLAAAPSAGATGGHYYRKDKVTICHATGSATNPYVKERVSESGVVNGHLGISHQNGQDIVPPFTYKGQSYAQNWDTQGQTIWNNGCGTTQQTEPATLTIKKEADPKRAQDFTFYSDELGDFVLDDDNDPTLSNQQVFTNLTPGEYGVREAALWDWQLAGLTCTGTTDYDVYWGEARVQVFLQAGDNVVCTFSNKQLNALGGFKFEDANGNAKWDNGEQTLEGWTITLTNGNVTKSIKTNVDGFYTFTGLEPGTYTVCEEQQAGWEQTFPANASGCHEVTLTGPGQAISCFHFGNVRKETDEEPELAEINGSKFNDVNGDTAWNSGEPTLSGWTITLKDSNDQTLATAVTDQNGFYRFANLRPGAYKVCETQQPAWVRTYPLASDCHQLSVAAGQAVTADFGNKPLPQVLGGQGASAPAVASLVNTGSSITKNLVVGLIILGVLGATQLMTIRRKEYAK